MQQAAGPGARAATGQKSQKSLQPGQASSLLFRSMLFLNVI
jgi:hypothetical protein